MLFVAGRKCKIILIEYDHRLFDLKLHPVGVCAAFSCEPEADNAFFAVSDITTDRHTGSLIITCKWPLFINIKSSVMGEDVYLPREIIIYFFISFLVAFHYACINKNLFTTVYRVSEIFIYDHTIFGTLR